MIIVVRTVGQ